MGDLPGQIPVWILSGVQGAGRSGLAEGIARRYARALQIRMNDMRRVFAPGGEVTPDALEGEIARRNAARLAAEHVARGSAAIIDDAITEDEIAPMLPFLTGLTVHKVLLSPSVFVVHRRVAKTDPAVLEAVKALHPKLVRGCPPEAGWFVLDTFARSYRHTVDALMAHFAQR